MSHLHAEHATLPEVEAFLRAHPYAILPIGSTEQHGPHLPFATDTLLARAFCDGLAEKSGGLVLPAIPVGYAWTWRDIPGTVSLRFDTLLDVVRDIAESLARTGVRALCTVSGHEANRGPLKYALRERIVDHVDIHVLNLFYPGMERILAEAESPAWHDGILHADEIETSMLLATHPELVHVDRAVRDYPEPPASYGMTRVTMGDLMRSGIFGDPTVADAGKGRRWLDLSTDEAARLWRAFLAEHDVTETP